jgi:hypothetical protein
VSQRIKLAKVIENHLFPLSRKQKQIGAMQESFVYEGRSKRREAIITKMHIAVRVIEEAGSRRKRCFLGVYATTSSNPRPARRAIYRYLSETHRL